jgi:hypothetical protein
MLQVVRDVLLRLLREPWFLGLVVPIAQPLISLALRRCSRRSRLDLGDWALGPELLITAIAIWLAAMAALGKIELSRQQKASMDLAFSALLFLGWLAFASSLGVRRWGLASDGKTPSPLAVAIPVVMGIVAVGASYLAVSAIAEI